MSAIAGLLAFGGRVVVRRDLERTANALSQYGPDRSQIVTTDTVGFVHTLMRMAPEDVFDSQPWQGETGSLITADIRLDNRDDLLARIGIRQTNALTWPDSRILLSAWEALGDDVWPMLRGAFAAAIWDRRHRKLTLARDHLGIKNLMWHQSARFFAFATMPKGLFAIDGVPRELSEEKFSDFLVLNHADHASTIYKNVWRLPPAHIMSVTADGLRSQRSYWSTDDIKAIRFGCDQDYADGLRDCLDRSVRRQMRSASAIGVLLSGGLDSSAVSALAARALNESGERLAAFTGVPRRGFDGLVPPGHYADETHYVQTIQEKVPNIDVNFVHNDACDDFGELGRFFDALEGPVRNPMNLGWSLAALRLARAQGRRVLLSGLFGNHTISWNGWSQAVTHLLRGKLLTAYQQWKLYYRRTPYSRWMSLRKLFIEPMATEWAADWMHDWSRRSMKRPWQRHSAINSSFAAEMGVDSRANLGGHDFLYRMRPNDRAQGLTQVDYIGDWFAAEQAVTGVEVRDPTADIDVVSYCLGIPPQQFLVEGTDRSLVRRAMWGLLPDVVLTKHTSGIQAADWYEKLTKQHAALTAQVVEISQSPLVRRIIDVPRLMRALQNWPEGGWHTASVFQEQNLALTRGIAAGRFLRWFESGN